MALIEDRRQGFDQAMWQAPTLTIAAQAFLLQVITDSSIHPWARLAVLLAGVAACCAAGAALLRLRAREVLHSRAVAWILSKHNFADPRSPSLEKLLPAEEKQDPPTVYLLFNSSGAGDGAPQAPGALLLLPRSSSGEVIGSLVPCAITAPASRRDGALMQLCAIVGRGVGTRR